MENKVKFKIGEIEFEAEGSAEVIERERKEFVDILLPAAIDAMIRTKGVHYIPQSDPTKTVIDAGMDVPQLPPLQAEQVDYSRESLASFLKPYGLLTDGDFVLLSAYFYEKKNEIKNFSVETIKSYYDEARRTHYSNYSVLISQLIQKGLIMQQNENKEYCLTSTGLQYVESYVPKNDSEEKKAKRIKKSKSTKSTSVYSEITADDLNLNNYPTVKDLQSGKDQIILAMYIITKENKGEWFTNVDIDYIMSYIFEVHITVDMINNLFRNNKSWFKIEQDDVNKKSVKRKLLSGAKDYAESLIKNIIQ
ncbi:MAG: hypothetical protein J1G07_00630 [Clostridiales bacterium]|nr:hypothetical protein [Clostridiales bacterium]